MSVSLVNCYEFLFIFLFLVGWSLVGVINHSKSAVGFFHLFGVGSGLQFQGAVVGLVAGE